MATAASLARQARQEVLAGPGALAPSLAPLRYLLAVLQADLATRTRAAQQTAGGEVAQWRVLEDSLLWRAKARLG